MRRRRLFPIASAAGFILIAFGGCAQLIGAEFDDARRAVDAAVVPPDVPLDVAIAPGRDVIPFDPRTAGDLQLWLDGTEGAVLADADASVNEDGRAPVPFAIAEWRDRSGHGHDGIQRDAARRPVLVPRALNGRDVVRFERRRETCLESRWRDGPGGTEATAFVVTKGDPASLLRFQGTINRWFIFPENPNATRPDAAPDFRLSLAVTTDSRFVRVEHRVDAWQVSTARVVVNVIGAVETWRNGVPSERSTVYANALPEEALNLGCYATGASTSSWADSDVAEILVYSTALPDAERRAGERYLQTKWGIFP